MLLGLPPVRKSDLFGSLADETIVLELVLQGAWLTVQFAQRNVLISSIVVWKYSTRSFVRSQTRASEGT